MIDSAPWQWLSFADPSLPEGSQLLGVAIVQGFTVVDAARVAWAFNCNPGGQVAMFALDPANIPPPEYRNRLLTDPDEQMAAGAMAKDEARAFMEGRWSTS